MNKNLNLLNNIKKILKDVRFGIFSNRLQSEQFPDNNDIVNDFNNMLDSLSDREKMLRENQIIMNSKTEQLEYIFNMLNDGAMILSEDFKILSVNSMQTKYFKKNKRKLLGKSLKDIIKSYNIFSVNTNEQLTDIKVFFEKEHKNTILKIEQNEQKSVFSISVKKLIMPDKSVNYFILSKNKTPEKKLEDLKNSFIATLTHDLKVPILAEKKVIELLMNDGFKENKKLYNEALLNMQNNNKDMMNLVMTLLDVYKLESGKFDISKASVNIYDLISDETDKLKYIAKENNVKFELTAQDKNLKILIDENNIARVFRNILNNALNYAPENTKIKIEIENNKNNIVVSVTDFGCGISKENISHIFDRYFTSNKKYRKVGTGLGLYLSKKIVELHKGEISVESIPCKETTFKIILPLNQ